MCVWSCTCVRDAHMCVSVREYKHVRDCVHVCTCGCTGVYVWVHARACSRACVQHVCMCVLCACMCSHACVRLDTQEVLMASNKSTNCDCRVCDPLGFHARPESAHGRSTMACQQRLTLVRVHSGTVLAHMLLDRDGTILTTSCEQEPRVTSSWEYLISQEGPSRPSPWCWQCWWW